MRFPVFNRYGLAVLLLLGGFAAAQTPSFEQAKKLFDEQNWAEAASAFAEVEKAQPGAGDALLYRAKALEKLQNLADAELALQSYLRGHKSAEASYLLADVLRREGKPKESLQAFQNAASQRPARAGELVVMALDAIDLREIDQAREFLEQALSREPDSLDARYHFARILYRQNRVQEAADAYQAVLARDPARIGAYYNLGLCFEHLGKPERSLELYRKAIELDERASTHTQRPYLYLGALLSKLGKPEEAIPYLQKSLAIKPDCSRSRSELGRVYYNLNRDGEAQQELEKAIAIDPTDSAAHYFLGRIYLRTGRREEAQKEFEVTRELSRKQSEGSMMGMGREMEMPPE